MAVHHSIPQYKLRKDRLEGWLLRTLGVYVKVEVSITRVLCAKGQNSEISTYLFCQLINSYYVFYLSQRLTQVVPPHELEIAALVIRSVLFG